MAATLSPPRPALSGPERIVPDQMAGISPRRRPSDRGLPGGSAGRQVVDGDSADGRGGEGVLDPGGDLGSGAAAGVRAACAEAAGALADEVVDPALGDPLLELRQRRARVGAVEP